MVEENLEEKTEETNKETKEETEEETQEGIEKGGEEKEDETEEGKSDIEERLEKLEKEFEEELKNWKVEGEVPKKIDKDFTSDVKFHQILRFFDIGRFQDQQNPENIRKVKAIYEYLKGSEDIIQGLRELVVEAGNPINLGERLLKCYAVVYSKQLENPEKKAEIKKTRKKELVDLVKKARDGGIADKERLVGVMLDTEAMEEQRLKKKQKKQ